MICRMQTCRHGSISIKMFEVFRVIEKKRKVVSSHYHRIAIFCRNCFSREMFDIFDSLQSLVKLEKVCIDNNVFRLHYKVSVVILMVFSILVNSRQYFGDPIDCTRNVLTENVIDNYCWMHSYAVEGDDSQLEIASYGVRPNKINSDHINYHRYYQWVGFVLFVQSILFFVPRYLWAYCWEEGRLKGLVGSLHCRVQECQEEKTRRLNLIIEYLIKNKGNHTVYAAKFFLCELLNLINVLGQIVLVDTFLGKAFTTFGVDVVSFITNHNYNGAVNPMEKMFPKTARCTFHYFGHGGGLEKFHAVCVLPVNMFNEKIYIFLWFYFVGLAGITAVALLYRVITIISCTMRRFLLRRRTNGAMDNSVKRIAKSSTLGDWFIIHQIGNNLDSLLFAELISNLDRRITVEKLMNSVFWGDNMEK